MLSALTQRIDELAGCVSPQPGGRPGATAGTQLTPGADIPEGLGLSEPTGTTPVVWVEPLDRAPVTDENPGGITGLARRADSVLQGSESRPAKEGKALRPRSTPCRATPRSSAPPP